MSRKIGIRTMQTSAIALASLGWASAAHADGFPGQYSNPPGQTGPFVTSFESAGNPQATNGYQSYRAISDGAYSNLDGQIADAEAYVETAQEDADAAAADLADAQAALDSLLADIDADEQALLDEVVAAQGVADGTQTARDDADDDLTAAQDVLADAQAAAAAASTAFNDAVQARIDAEAALDADPTNATLAQALIDAQQAEADAAVAVAPSLAAVADAQAVVDAAQDVFDAAVLADNAADADLAAAQVAAAAVTPASADIIAAQNDLAAAADVAADAGDLLENRQNSLASLNRADEVLTDAATSENAAIADAAGALLGTAQDTDFEVEAVAALVDHEDRITANADAITAETARATAAEEGLQTAIDTERDERVAADLVLQSNIEAETARATAAEGVLQTAIDTEATTRAAADTRLQAAVDAEVAARTAAVTTERNERVAADNQLLTRLTAEETARVAADTALSNRMTGVEANVAALNGRVGVLEDKVSSSAATAMALGGMAFLPDMKFNLAATVSTFEGAQAVAAQMGVRVSNNVAISAGVATGLNKHGSTGGRVGIIFGW